MYFTKHAPNRPHPFFSSGTSSGGRCFCYLPGAYTSKTYDLHSLSLEDVSFFLGILGCISLSEVLLFFFVVGIGQYEELLLFHHQSPYHPPLCFHFPRDSTSYCLNPALSQTLTTQSVATWVLLGLQNGTLGSPIYYSALPPCLPAPKLVSAFPVS